MVVTFVPRSGMVPVAFAPNLNTGYPVMFKGTPNVELPNKRALTFITAVGWPIVKLPSGYINV